MSSLLLVEQALNGLQFGLMLFLLAAGLTMCFGVMDMINLAHGSLYMVGAFLAAWLTSLSGSFWLGPGRVGGADGGRRHADRIDAAAHAVRARPPVAGAGHVCADPDPERRREDGLRHRPAAVGAGGAGRAGAVA
jgi:ABC-type branched-subunit amino acid transport system permease subunit